MEITEKDRAEARQTVAEALMAGRERARAARLEQERIDAEWDKALLRYLDEQHQQEPRVVVLPSNPPKGETCEPQEARKGKSLEDKAWTFLYGLSAGALGALALVTAALLALRLVG